MSAFRIMPRAYRRQLQATDEANVRRATSHTEDTPEGSAGILRGIPAIGKGCPGHIRDTDPGGTLIRTCR